MEGLTSLPLFGSFSIMPAKDPRSTEIDQMILEVYPTQGPQPIMDRFGLSKSSVYSRANKLRILADPERHGSGTRDPRRDEIDQMIREVYPDQGPEPIMEKFELTKNSVHTHARLLGVKFDWETRKAEILRMIQDVYPEHGPKLIAERFGLSLVDIYRRARLNGIKVNKEGQYGRASETKTDLFDTLDLSFWTPELTKIGAYYLGLAWSDATTALLRKNWGSQEQSKQYVMFSQSGDGDRDVVDYLARILGLPEDRVRPAKKYKDSHKTPYRLKLSGKRIASLFVDHFKIPMRKSFIDPLYPNIPDEFLAAFVCGQYDGDGSTVVFEENSPNPYYRFYGTPLFLETFRQKLQDQVGVQFRPIRLHQRNGKLWVFGVYDVRQTVPLTRFLHREYYGEEGVPYFKRKHEPFRWFLTPGYFTIRGGHLVYL
jgi:hypothetical protein